MRKDLLLSIILALLVTAQLFVSACTEDSSSPAEPEQPVEPADTVGLLPVITWDEPSARFRIYTDETLMLVPVITGTDETTTYTWTMNDSVVSTEDHFSFLSHEAGEFFVQLAVSNRYGITRDEAKITVQQNQNAALPELPTEHRLWCFPWTEIHIAQGRTIPVIVHLLQSIPDDTHLTWTLDGITIDPSDPAIIASPSHSTPSSRPAPPSRPAPSSRSAPSSCLAPSSALVSGGFPAGVASFLFTAADQGTHHLALTLQTPDTTAIQTFTLHVCPPPGTHQRSSRGRAIINKVYEFMPAPGHQVNGYIIVGDSYPPGCTHEQACDSVLAHFQRRWSVSLGSQGGYLIAGFDHSVRNSGGDYDLCIKGNPFSYQSEPGIIWVSQDDNGDGLPNDQWFELAGSEYGTERHLTNYAITYYRPTLPHSATAWRDCLGEAGYVPYLSYWNPHDYYWQPWVEGTEHTYFASRLADRSTYENGISVIPPYDWGYVDNLSNPQSHFYDFIDGPAGKMNYFRLSNARTWDGQPANLEYIDFIKIQTAQIGSTPNLGDISTEVYYISDYHCEN